MLNHTSWRALFRAAIIILRVILVFVLVIALFAWWGLRLSGLEPWTVLLGLVIAGLTTLLQKFSSSTLSSQADSLLEGEKAPGKLHVSDIQVVPKENGACTLDFRVSNSGGSDVLINKIKLEVLDIGTVFTLGHLELSKVYDLSISPLRKIGDSITCDVSQLVKAGEVDRFGITLIAEKIGTGVHRMWRLLPTLITNFGEITGQAIELWLPKKIATPEVAKESQGLTKEQFVAAFINSHGVGAGYIDGDVIKSYLDAYAESDEAITDENPSGIAYRKFPDGRIIFKTNATLKDSIELLNKSSEQDEVQ